VIGGMLAASFIAIFLIPVLFYLVEKFSDRKREIKPEEPQVEEVGASRPAGTTKH
jgi:hypothetical protein